MAVFPTEGTLHMRLADAEPVFSCDGCTVTYHRTVVPPGEVVPEGGETVTVSSPAGFISYEERDGVHHLTWLESIPEDSDGEHLF
jgi:hypothetical protein